MLVSALLLVAIGTPAKQPYHFDASFIECCSCRDVCVTEITGRDAGCHGFGAIKFRTGSYAGKDISGTAAAFAFDSGKWVRIYIDAPDKQRAAVTNLMKAALADWGKLEGIRNGSVRLTRNGDAHSLIVDKGHTMMLVMKPVLGGDGKSAVTHTNLASPLHSSLMQGVTSSAQFSDFHPFKLAATNGFFNEHCVMKGGL
jgi:hypothetical protein